MNLFVRNSPEVVRDSIDLNVEEFVGKYRQNTTEEVLSRAYFEIRKKELIKNPPPEIYMDTKSELPKTDFKKVTFKVIKTKKEDIGKKPFVKPIQDEEEIINELLNIEDSEENTSTAKPKKKPSSEREELVISLLKQDKKAKEIIETLVAKGITIYAPQVSIIKKNNNL